MHISHSLGRDLEWGTVFSFSKDQFTFSYFWRKDLRASPKSGTWISISCIITREAAGVSSPFTVWLANSETAGLISQPRAQLGRRNKACAFSAATCTVKDSNLLQQSRSLHKHFSHPWTLESYEGSLPSPDSSKISTVPLGRKTGEDPKTVWRKVMFSFPGY